LFLRTIYNEFLILNYKYRDEHKDIIVLKRKEYYIKSKYLSAEDTEFKYNTKYYKQYILNQSNVI